MTERDDLPVSIATPAWIKPKLEVVGSPTDVASGIPSGSDEDFTFGPNVS